MTVVSRVSVDIDSHRRNVRLKVLQAYHGLQNAGAVEVVVAISSSGEGFHVEGRFERPVGMDERFALRERLHDDENRLRMDRQRAERGLPIGTMWRRKAGNEGERVVYDTPEEAIGHTEVVNTDWHTRAKGVQNHGRKAIMDTEVPHTKAIMDK